MEISFSLFHLSSLSFLICINKPLEVILFELANIWMIFLLSNLDAFIPSVKLLVHGHSLFNFIILEKDSFSSVELLI
jgi:hypothetical protein